MRYIDTGSRSGEQTLGNWLANLEACHIKHLRLQSGYFNAHDAPEGRKLMRRLDRPAGPTALVMDRAYEDNATRQLALALGFEPVVPPKANRIDPWEYKKGAVQAAQ